jgi:hypothetical protein
MQTLIVPAMLVAMVAAWLPAQVEAANHTFKEIGCSLSLARQAPDLNIGPEDACRALVELPADTDRSPVMAALVQWQSLADL